MVNNSDVMQPVPQDLLYEISDNNNNNNYYYYYYKKKKKEKKGRHQLSDVLILLRIK